MDELYTSGRYGEQHPEWHEADAEKKAASLHRFIRYCGLRPSSVLDVGTGTGAVLQALKEHFDGELPQCHWEGWDIASDAIARARKREGPRLQFVCDRFERSERSGDLLLLIDVVEHVLDDVSFLQSMRSRASHLVLRVPLDLSVLDLLRPTRLTQVRRQYGHVQLYNAALIRARLQEAGLQIDHMWFDRIYQPTTARQRLTHRVRDLSSWWSLSATVELLGGYSALICCHKRAGLQENTR